MEPPYMVLLGFLAIIFVPTVGLLACREILREYDIVETAEKANKYALFTGGASVLSVIPAAEIINRLPTQAHIIHVGEADTPYQNAWYYEDFSAEMQNTLNTAIAKDKPVALPDSISLPSEFVMMDRYASYEFSVITDVILFGQPMNEFYALLFFMTLFTMFWGLLTLSYLIFVRDADETSDSSGVEIVDADEIFDTDEDADSEESNDSDDSDDSESDAE